MRDLSSSVLAELLKQNVRPFIACEIDFADQILRVWSGIGTLSIPTPVHGGPPLAIATTSEVHFGDTVRIALAATPDIAIAVGQNYRLEGLTSAPWLNGVVATVTGSITSSSFDAAYNHSVYGATSDTGTATLLSDGIENFNYLGVGNLASIAPVVETSALQANGLALGLSGVPSDVLAESLGFCRQGLPVRILFGLIDSTGAIIADPTLLFSGRMDTVSVDEGADTALITITAESRIIDMQKPRIRRYTDDDQQRTNPGDLGFEFVPMIQDWNGSWGLHDRGR